MILGVGGTTRQGSTGEKALRFALDQVQRAGGCTQLLTAHDLDLPMFDPAASQPAPEVAGLLAAVRSAEGIIIAAPTYHAGISGLMKNLLDHLEHLREDSPPYLDGRRVGCIVTGAGSQGGAMTLSALRSVAHALRGWPTPLGVVVDSSGFLPDGAPASETTASQLTTMAHQVLGQTGPPPAPPKIAAVAGNSLPADHHAHHRT